MVRRSNATGSGTVIVALILAAVILGPNLFGFVTTGVSEANFRFGDVSEPAFLVTGVIKGGDSEQIVTRTNTGTEFEEVTISSKLTNFDCVYDIINEQTVKFDKFDEVAILITNTEGGFRNSCTSPNRGGELVKIRGGLVFDSWGCQVEDSFVIGALTNPFVEYDAQFTITHEGRSNSKVVNHEKNRVDFYLGGELFATIDETRNPSAQFCSQPPVNVVQEDNDWTLVDTNVKNDLQDVYRTFKSCYEEIGTRSIFTSDDQNERDLINCMSSLKSAKAQVLSPISTNLVSDEDRFIESKDPMQPPSFGEFSLFIKADEVLIDASAAKPVLTFVSKSDEYVADEARPLVLNVENIGETAGEFQITGSCSPSGRFDAFTTARLNPGQDTDVTLQVSSFVSTEASFECEVNALGGRGGGSTSLLVEGLKAVPSITAECSTGRQQCSNDGKSIEECVAGNWVNVKPCAGKGNTCFLNETTSDYECTLTGGTGGGGLPLSMEVIMIILGFLALLYIVGNRKGGGSIGSFQSFGSF